MKSSSSSVPQPEAILEWLQKEMGYRPLGPYASSKAVSLPSIDSLRKIFRGNMIPVWNFLLNRVKSEKTVEKIRRNILVHGGGDVSDNDSTELVGHVRSRGRKNEKDHIRTGIAVEGPSSADSRETALHERESAEKEVEKLRNIVKRQRKELRARMLEISGEEAERKRLLNERSNHRHKQVMLQAYEKQCDMASKIFAEYHKRLDYYVKVAKSTLMTKVDSSSEINGSHVSQENLSIYSTVKNTNSSDDTILLETALDLNIRVACETLAGIMIQKVRHSFPSYDGAGIHSDPLSDLEKLSFDFVCEVPNGVRDVILDSVKHPSQLLKAINAYTLRLETLLSKEIETIDISADAETLRFQYRNNTVMDHSTPSSTSQLYEEHSLEKEEINVPFGGSHDQLLERQKAHVQQFIATEEALNKAAEAKDQCEKLIERLHGSGDLFSSNLSITGASQMGSFRQLELDVLAKEREAAGLRASLDVLAFEVERLSTLCAERKEAESSLRKKWKKIQEFDMRRSELESIYAALLNANMDAVAFWSRMPSVTREYASSTIIPACFSVIDLSNSARDLVEKEVSAFYHSPDNNLYMLPSTSQALAESIGASGTSQEVVASAEKNATLLTARAGSGDPSAIPSICRVSAALQYPSDTGLESVLESLRFCLKCRGSEASVLSELVKAIDLVRTRKDLVESGRTLLAHASCAHQEYERTTSYCLSLSGEQDKAVMEKWLPEVRGAVLNARKGLEDCKYVKGLLEEWWEQPASTVVDWITVDGQNVITWTNHVKQLLAFYDKELL